MTTLEIVDKIYPLTDEDKRCGIKKADKLRKRAELIRSLHVLKQHELQVSEKVNSGSHESL